MLSLSATGSAKPVRALKCQTRCDSARRFSTQAYPLEIFADSFRSPTQTTFCSLQYSGAATQAPEYCARFSHLCTSGKCIAHMLMLSALWSRVLVCVRRVGKSLVDR